MVRKNSNRQKILVIISLTFFLLSYNLGLSQNDNRVSRCRGTYYHDRFENRYTASGDIFSQKLYTAAHKTIPFHTVVKATNVRTKKSVLVKINDRCARHGILDFAKTAAKAINLNGSEAVTVEILGKNYKDIWEHQTLLIKSGVVTDSLRTVILDSLIEERKTENKFLYNVKLAVVVGEMEAYSIIEQLDSKHKLLATTERFFDDNLFCVNIGPFVTLLEANSALNDLKKNYRHAHVLKRKNNLE